MALYIIATPIGNLEDISFRAIKTLKKVDFILCEDTRVTKKLLEKYNIKVNTISYHQHSKIKKINHVLNLLKEGKNLALVSDAGTPGISDPGNKLIEEILKEIEIDIIPIPGPCAFAAGASICNFAMDKFQFLGFPPVKKKRKKFFQETIDSKYPVVLYESTHRIIKTLKELEDMVPKDKKQDVVVCRELTKKFETIYRGSFDKVINDIENSSIKGEFCIIVNIS